MYVTKLLFFCFILLSIECYSQEKDSLQKVLDGKFQSFEYGDAVHIANILLKTAPLSKEEKLEVLRIKGVALYNLAEEDSAGIVFSELIKLDDNYFLDPVRNSPKIVELFNNIKVSQKESVRKEVISETPLPGNRKAVLENKVSYINSGESLPKALIVRSLIFPGWGHFKGGEQGKGWLFSSAGLISLSSMVYFLVDCNTKEREYLRETDLFSINDKYRKYNTSYKMRNISIAAYAAVWLYSQLDLLYISDFRISTQAISSNTSSSFKDIYFSYRIYF